MPMEGLKYLPQSKSSYVNKNGQRNELVNVNKEEEKNYASSSMYDIFGHLSSFANFIHNKSCTYQLNVDSLIYSTITEKKN